MTKLRVKTKVDEYHNTHYYTTFDIEYEKPEVEEEFSPRTGTRISEVFPVIADLHLDNIYSPDSTSFFELWGVKILTDEEDESCFDYRYIAVPFEPEYDEDEEDND